MNNIDLANIDSKTDWNRTEVGNSIGISIVMTTELLGDLI